MRGAEHHAPYAGDALDPKDVVLDDEGTRFCGKRSTTSGTSAARKLQTTGAGKATKPTAAEPVPQPEAPPLGGAPPRGRRPFRSATAHQKRTDAQSVLLILLFCLIHPAFQSIRLDQVSPTSPSGFSWSSSWTVASSGFWHVPAKSGRSAAGPWSRTGSSNSCCGLGSAPR